MTLAADLLRHAELTEELAVLEQAIAAAHDARDQASAATYAQDQARRAMESQVAGELADRFGRPEEYRTWIAIDPRTIDAQQAVKAARRVEAQAATHLEQLLRQQARVSQERAALRGGTLQELLLLQGDLATARTAEARIAERLTAARAALCPPDETEVNGLQAERAVLLAAAGSGGGDAARLREVEERLKAVRQTLAEEVVAYRVAALLMQGMEDKLEKQRETVAHRARDLALAKRWLLLNEMDAAKAQYTQLARSLAQAHRRLYGLARLLGVDRETPHPPPLDPDDTPEARALAEASERERLRALGLDL